jgi:predicted MPP superfamily phosphohydrolase
MGFVLTVVTVLLLLDVLWAVLSDRFLRGARGARWWRGANLSFVGMQVLILLWIFVDRLLDLRLAAPKPIVGATLIWHLIVLPVTAVLMGVPAIPLAIFRVLRSLFPVLRGEGRGEGRATFANDVRSIAAPPHSRFPVLRGEGGGEGQATPANDVRSTTEAPRPSPLPSPPSTGEREDASSRATDASLPTAVSRRSFLRTAAVMTPPVITTIATVASIPQLNQFRVRRLTLSLPALPASLDGMTIAHVSDTHVGRLTRGPILDAVVRATNDLEADLVLFTGDLINDALADLDDAINLIQRLDPRRGLALCEGNHDLIESRAEFERRTRQASLPMLINETTTVRVRGEPIQLLGLRWGSGVPGASRAQDRGDAAVRSSMDVLLRQLRADAFHILLAHHPHAFDPAAAAGIPLTLAGHTHGGQLMLTDTLGFGPAMFRYWSGAYRKGDNALVVSNGVGNWFPLRINAPAEIVHLTLRRG